MALCFLQCLFLFLKTTTQFNHVKKVMKYFNDPLFSCSEVKYELKCVADEILYTT